MFSFSKYEVTVVVFTLTYLFVHFGSFIIPGVFLYHIVRVLRQVYILLSHIMIKIIQKYIKINHDDRDLKTLQLHVMHDQSVTYSNTYMCSFRDKYNIWGVQRSCWKYSDRFANFFLLFYRIYDKTNSNM